MSADIHINNPTLSALLHEHFLHHFGIEVLSVYHYLPDRGNGRRAVESAEHVSLDELLNFQVGKQGDLHFPGP